MTSIQLFPPVDQVPSVPKEWGSGKYKEDVNVFIPAPPTWQYSGKPIDQYYSLTQLKLSNVRSNDELVPRPQGEKMGELLLNRDFPSEHPYSSHMPRYAMFPKFDSPEDPKRGVEARKEQPINAEMPATAFDVAIVRKTKGHGERHELQALPRESEKRALEWSGEHGFHQLPKAHGGRQQFYPIPPKTVAPNLQDRWQSMKSSDRTANALRNVERNQWQTSYNLNHTGLGPANPLKLDNHTEKVAFKEATGLDDDILRPHFTNTFDPPRPFEGRIARHLIPKPPPQKPSTVDPDNPDYVRMKTLREIEEDRLLNGKEYANLPDTQSLPNNHNDLRWKELNDTSHPDPNITILAEARERQPADDIPFHPVTETPLDTEEKYLETTKEKKDHQVQEMEAQNRFRLLESQTPGNDISSLNYKYGHVYETEKPSTFYRHEGKYNEERAGLYRTSYLPERLANSLSGLEKSGPEIMNTMHSHVDAGLLPTKLSTDIKETLRYSRALNTSMPNMAGGEVLMPLQQAKEANKRMLQPTQDTARTKVVERETVLKDSTMGDSYNTKKFLQEHELPRFARNEPLNVISTENQNLTNVRMVSGLKSQKSVSFSDNVTVAHGDENGQLVIKSAPVFGTRTDPTSKVDLVQYRSTHALWSRDNEKENVPKPKVEYSIFDIQPKAPATQNDEFENIPLPLRKPRRRAATSLGDTEYKDQFDSLSSNVAPTNLRNSMTFATSYESQFPTYHSLSYKADPRFSWEPGQGSPRPQTKLLKIQDSFSKSSVRRKFHQDFMEQNPDLRDNIVKGKKHTFFGMNAQNLHG